MRTRRACWAAADAARSTICGVHGRVDIQVGTLSKAIGSMGGYVCGSKDLIEFSVPPRAAVSFFHVASALGDGHLPGGIRRCWIQRQARS